MVTKGEGETMATGDPGESLWERYYAAALAGESHFGSQTREVCADQARKTADRALANHYERWPRDREVITREQFELRRYEMAHEAATFVVVAIDYALLDLRRDNRGDAAEVLQEFQKFAADRMGPVYDKEANVARAQRVHPGIPFSPKPRPQEPLMTTYTASDLLAAAREVVAAYDDPRGLQVTARGEKTRMRKAMDALEEIVKRST